MTSLGVEHELLRESVRAFAEREVVPYLEGWERAGEVPRELHRKAAGAGLLAVDFPEEVGGAGGDFLHSVVITEELIQSGRPPASALRCSRMGSRCRTSWPPATHARSTASCGRRSPAR